MKNVFARIWDILTPDMYDPDEEDPVILHGRETIRQARSERKRLQGTLKRDRETGFFLGDSLTVHRKTDDDHERH